MLQCLWVALDLRAHTADNASAYVKCSALRRQCNIAAFISLCLSCCVEFATTASQNDTMIRTWFTIGNLGEDSEEFRQSSLPDAAAMQDMAHLLSSMVDSVFSVQVGHAAGSTMPCRPSLI